MKRALLVLSLGLGFPFTACLNLKPCATDMDCAPSGRCDPQQFCVFDPNDGGSGGGATVGGGEAGQLSHPAAQLCHPSSGIRL